MFECVCLLVLSFHCLKSVRDWWYAVVIHSCLGLIARVLERSCVKAYCSQVTRKECAFDLSTARSHAKHKHVEVQNSELYDGTA